MHCCNIVLVEMKLLMKKSIFKTLVIFLFFSSGNLVAQEVWSLQRCVSHALENNITLKNAVINEEMAAIAERQARHNRYPGVNASTNLGNNFGRTIDPATNQFRSQNLTFNSWSINMSVPIFNGFAIVNSIRQADLDLRAAEFDTEQARDDLSLNVVTYYLNVLFAEDNLNNALNQLDISSRQLDRMNSLIQAGAMAPSEKYDLEVQVALDEEQVVQARNGVDQSMVQLKNLLLLDPDREIQLERPDLEVPESEPLLNMDFATLYRRALESQASIKSSELQIESSRLGEKIASGSLMPSVSFGGSVSTNYSSRAQMISGFEFELNQIPVAIDGEPAILSLLNEVPVLEDQSYLDQLDANFGYGVGLTVTIPIYNKLSNRLNYQRAKLNTVLIENSDEQLRQNLRTNVSQARSDARAAAKAFAAAQKSLEASEMALNNAERKLEAGTATSFDLINSQNQLNTTRNNLLQARYDYIFKLKVIDYYLGNPIILD